MSRVAYERVFGQSGYDAVARNKIKKLEEKIGSGSSGGGKNFMILYLPDNPEAAQLQRSGWDFEELASAFYADFGAKTPAPGNFCYFDTSTGIVYGGRQYQMEESSPVVRIEFYGVSRDVEIDFESSTIRFAEEVAT